MSLQHQTWKLPACHVHDNRHCGWDVARSNNAEDAVRGAWDVPALSGSSLASVRGDGVGRSATSWCGAGAAGGSRTVLPGSTARSATFAGGGSGGGCAALGKRMGGGSYSRRHDVYDFSIVGSDTQVRIIMFRPGMHCW